MKTILDSRKHHYVARACIFLIMVASIAGMVGCGDTTTPRYDLTMAVNPVGGGKATDLRNAPPYAAGTAVNIIAVPAAGYQFVNWSAPAGTFGNPTAANTTFTMPAQEVTVTAHFVGPLDHFTYYWTSGESSIGEDVYLEDRFGAVNATVGSAMGFGNPAQKWHNWKLTPISNPDHHFTAYELYYEGEPQIWVVEVNNQFGTQQLTVQGPIGLIVPTQKVELTYHGPPVGLDHYLVYSVMEGPYISEVVALRDQFGEQPLLSVYQPVAFANPVRITHNGNVVEIRNPEAHAVIYEISGEYFEREVQVVNQFGEQTLDVYGPAMLAVPSEKLSYEPFVCALTMAVDPVGGGTATDLTNASPYAVGTMVSIQAVPAADYQFVRWTAPAGTFANPYDATTTFTMPAQDVTVTANFVGLPVLGVAAVLGDYDSQLTKLLLANNIWADERDWDVIDDIGDYDVVVVNQPYDPGETTFQDFLDAASANGVGVVFTSSYPVGGSWGISLLEWYLDDPAGQSEASGWDDVYYKVTQAHPIFAGWNVNDEITIITGGDRDHAWFWDYTGTTIAEVGSNDDGIQGGAVAVGTYGGSTHVLLASLGPQSWTDVTHWTDDARTIFINAVLFAGGIP